MKLTPQIQALILSLSLAVGFNCNSAPAGPTPNALAEFWTASLTAEADGNYDEALKKAAAWQAAGGSRFMAALRTGWLSYLKKDYPKAATSYEEAAKLNPTSLTPLYGLLSTAQALNSKEKVKTASEMLLKLEPTNYKALMAQAYSHFLAMDYRRALSQYRTVLASYPENTDALSGFAWSAYYAGEKRDALKTFQILVSIYPDYPSAQTGLELSAVIR